MALPDISFITAKVAVVQSVEPNTIIVIDDKPEQLAAAEKAVTDAGYKVRAMLAAPTGDYGQIEIHHVLWDTLALPGVVGVLTDLMFPLTSSSGLQPNGILVALHAIGLGLPVVICTDADGGHHAGGCGAVRDGYNSRVRKPAFGFNESKDWAYAMKELILRMKTAS